MGEEILITSFYIETQKVLALKQNSKFNEIIVTGTPPTFSTISLFKGLQVGSVRKYRRIVYLICVPINNASIYKFTNIKFVCSRIQIGSERSEIF